MKLRKSIFLKAFVFLFSAFCIFYACFIVTSNLTVSSRLLTLSNELGINIIPDNLPENLDTSDHPISDPLIPVPTINPNLQNTEGDSPRLSDFSELTTSERQNIDFTNSVFGSVFWIALTLFLVLCGFVYHCLSIGWQKGSDQLQFSIIKKWPLDLLSIPTISLILLFVSLGFYLTDLLYQNNLAIFPSIQIFLSTIVTGIFVIVYSFLLLVVGQIKAGTIIKSSLIYNVIRLITRFIQSMISGLKKIYYWFPILWREILIIFSFIIVNIILISILQVNYSFLILFFLILYNIAFLFVFVSFINNFQKITKAIMALSQGQLDYYLDKNKVSPDFHDLVYAINNLIEGINLAIEEKTKSELFKTELITNVSHDIKTPLTSIIAYTDLLQRENVNSEQSVQYIEVLSKQANRLKNLIEDLIEASKISTGNIKVQMMPLDLKQMLEQAYAEYEKKLRDAQLKFILTLPEKPCIIWADGIYFWRVLDNLLSNVVKYSQSNTRVYLDVLDSDTNIIKIRMRNVSDEPLNISTDQLFERFVQGDKSRSQGGSGIGLSIAQSLMQAQNGSMDIQIDGDLFTVELIISKKIEQNRI